jgi:GAF domain
MSTTFILATTDLQLAAMWEAQIPPGRPIVRLFATVSQAVPQAGLSAVVVLDASSEPQLPHNLVKCPTIYVGEPRSLPFEQARLAGRAKVYLNYDESTRRLREFLPLMEELAAKESMLALLMDKGRRAEGSGSRAPMRASAATETAELWDFLEGAVESIDSRDRLLGEFRRASRHLLRASHAVFFLRETDGFRADRGTSFFPNDDPLVGYLEGHPAVIDGASWDGPGDPMAELAVRNRLAMWGARLLVPIHDNGRLLGLIALGVRDDGQPYDESDRVRAVCVARLLRQFLAKATQLGRLQIFATQATLGAKYLPSTLILAPEENVPRQVPLVVRDLIGRVRRTREVSRMASSEGQPFRASAGLVAETGGVWAFWEEASGEVHDAAGRRRAARMGLLRELALTLSHELGNALVSLATFRQVPEGSTVPPAMVATIKGDIAKLEELSGRMAVMQSLDELVPAKVDIRELAQGAGSALGVRVEVGPDPVILSAAKDLLQFALSSLIETITENRGELGARELALQVRSTGTGAELTALLSLKGRHLELEGILPEPVTGAVPNQGRMGVFLAKEILRLHHGEIHAGPGMEGTEILISLRSC